GLRDLLDHLRGGGAFEPLFTGKFALTHLPVLEQLVDAGWVVPPALLPRYASADGFAPALDRCRTIGVEALYHHRPSPTARQEPAARATARCASHSLPTTSPPSRTTTPPSALRAPPPTRGIASR